MGWFSGDDDYDKDGNPQRTRKCSGSLLESLGTADLDYLFKAYAPELVEVHVETIKGLNAIYTLIENLQKTVELQNRQLSYLRKTLEDNNILPKQ